MEGFTLVLVGSWLLLVGIFVGMYFLDKATKRAMERRAAPSGQIAEKSQRR
jgi:uncharacterized protein YneF (UPF0154 family)